MSLDSNGATHADCRTRGNFRPTVCLCEPNTGKAVIPTHGLAHGTLSSLSKSSLWGVRWRPSPASSNVTSPTKSSSPPHGHGSADGSNHGCAARNSSAPGRAAVADVGAMRGSGGGWQKPNFSQVTEIYFVAQMCCLALDSSRAQKGAASGVKDGTSFLLPWSQLRCCLRRSIGLLSSASTHSPALTWQAAMVMSAVSAALRRTAPMGRVPGARTASRALRVRRQPGARSRRSMAVDTTGRAPRACNSRQSPACCTACSLRGKRN